MAFLIEDSNLTIKTDFPHTVHKETNLRIPMPDGCQLAADLWLPEDAETSPIPAILEYIPYRKNDLTAMRDSIRHPYFAGHGYACLRVDTRGCGDSEGVMLDEYLKQEQDDGLSVIEWIANQPWCDGNVGMIGKSWGGFNGLQIAARRPPALKTIITLCSTDDRYADDVHYKGGSLLASNMLWWASIMLAYNALPPDPATVGDGWRDLWLQRLEQVPPFVEEWMRHPQRDAYWKHGSVCENFSDIECPVFAVGGWADGYTNAIFRMLEGLSVPRKGLIGPWAHEYPEVATPAPAIGFLQECLRWWDRWLKGNNKDIEIGIKDEPILWAWMQESVPPQTTYAARPGRWVGESTWPAPTIVRETYRLEKDGLKAPSWKGQHESTAFKNPHLRSRKMNPLTSGEKISEHFGSQIHGLFHGSWCPFGEDGDSAPDQRGEDALSTCFDAAPLTESTDYLGLPEVHLCLSVDQPVAQVAVRLCDVAPSGESLLVSWGVLNLTHAAEPGASHESPKPLTPDKLYNVTIKLDVIGHTLPVDHHWRIAISPTYWPHLWPSPNPVTLTLWSGSELSLPLRPKQPSDADLAPFEPPETAPKMAHEILRDGTRRRSITHDLITQTATIFNRSDGGAMRLLPADSPIPAIEIDSIDEDTYTIAEGDPLSAQIVCTREIKLGRIGWRVRLQTQSRMWCDAEMFHIFNSIICFENGEQVFAREWEFSKERRFI